MLVPGINAPPEAMVVGPTFPEPASVPPELTATPLDDVRSLFTSSTPPFTVVAPV